jgi:excisionase family DNA binding protein
LASDVPLATAARLYDCMSDHLHEASTHRDLQLLDIPEVAERLSVSPRFIRRLVNERRIPYCKLGKFVRFDAAEVAEWVTKMRMDVLQ